MSPLYVALITTWITALFVPMVQAAVPANTAVTLRTQISGDSISVPLALSYQQVVLEKRSGSGWRPVAVQYPRSLTREQMRNITFALPAGTLAEDVRVQGYRSPKFPSRFIHGKRVFSRSEEAGAIAPVATGLDRLKITPSQPAVVAPGPDLSAQPPLWKLVDNQLFFYNQQRGLQVLNLSDPANPLRTGAVRLPAVGIQMFVLDAAGTQLALLGRSNGKNKPGAGVLYLLRITAGVPALVGELPLDGSVVSGLLVGSELHLLSVSKVAKQAAKTLLTRVDVTTLETPAVLGRLTFIGHKPALLIQGGKLLVRVTEAGEKRLHEVAVGKGVVLPKPVVEVVESPQILGYEISVHGPRLKAKSVDRPEEPPMEMSLAWQTDRVLPVGDYLVQVEDGDGTGHEPLPPLSPNGLTSDEDVSRLRITPATDPDLLVEELVLGPGKVVALSQQGDHLFVAQWVPATLARQAILRTWALDLGDPTAITELGVVEQDLHGLDAWDLALADVQPLWVNPQTLVWFLPAKHYPSQWWSRPLAIHPAKPASKDIIPAAAEVMVLCPVRFAKGSLTAKDSQVFRIRGRVTATSRAFAEAGFLFFSHDTSDAITSIAGDEGDRVKVPLRLMPDQRRSWLQVVDFRGGSPLLREAVSIPGQLLGVALADAQGALLLTHSDLALRRDASPARVVQASAYDGVNAYLLDDYVTATSFHSAALADGLQLYLTREMGRAGVVAVGYDPLSGRLGQSSTWNTNAAPTRLHVAAGHLLASSYGNLEVASLSTSTGRLTPIASYDTPTSLWLQVERAAVTPSLDIWIPAGDYGVEYLQKQGLGP